ncbi:hypothetical protein GFD17_04145 [Bifidobacterium sp. SMB2]|uniref:Cell division protein FtsL n=1 Tax=Bifidobacterium saimiriisciurei TaxID=2661627 RepID=A0ABX0CGK2_9BIFI|nr:MULTISPECIES: hypothetical protein [Bifidobacterium]NEG95961.1 hypothetical protein [Bifidobacterium sp. SMB2]NEH11808.1 hypothetical protein [Bifidobacterium saimiriisciurei]
MSSSRTARKRIESAPRGMRSQTQSRPHLRVSSSEQGDPETLRGRLKMVMGNARPKRLRIFHFVCAIVFLAASLIGSLVLRTQMVEDSFAITDTQQSIGRLTQDVQERQTKLDALEASLPQKAQKLGMVPGSDALTIDLQGYQSGTSNAKGSK